MILRRNSKTINILVLAIALCSIALLATPATGSTCFQYLTDLDSLYFTGEVSSPCSFSCSNYRTVGIEFIKNYELAGLCFCRNSSTPASVSTTTCAGSQCDSLVKSCEYTGFSTGNNDSKSVPTLKLSNPQLAGQPVKFSVEGADTGDVFKYDFGDGTIQEIGASKIKYAYLTPGYFFCRVTVKKIGWNITLERIINVVSNISQIIFKKPPVIEVGVAENVDLTIGGGTNMNITITQTFKEDGKANADKLEFDLSTDVLVLRFAPPLPYSISSSTSGDNVLVVIPSLAFTESGFLSHIGFDARYNGVLNLFILRPQCNRKQFSAKRLRCVNPDIVSLMGDESITSEPVMDDQLTFNLTQNIMVDVTSKGSQLNYFQTNDIYVKKGDILAMRKSKGSDKLKYVETSSGTYSYFKSETAQSLESSLVPGSIVGPFVDKEDKVPVLVGYLSKGFKYPMLQTRDKPGTLTLAVDCVTAEASYTNEVHVPVQERITGLSFMQGYPESTYPMTVKDIEVKTEVDTGSSISYLFNMSFSSQVQFKKNSTDGTAVFTNSDWELGEYEINLEAYNLINSVSSNFTFAVRGRIDGQNMYIQDKLIDVNKDFDLHVQVFNGTNITVEVDFGDNTIITRNIVDGYGNKGNTTITHSFKKCDTYTIRARVKNIMTQGEWEKFYPPKSIDNINVSISCPISDIALSTSPAVNQDDILKMSISDKLEVDVLIKQGSYAIYRIYWGDGESSIENQTALLKPVEFMTEHKYATLGNFTIYVMAENHINWRVSRNISVVVQNCTKPVVYFEYGTKENRFMFTRGETMEFVGDWTYRNEICRSKIEKHFSPVSCIINGGELADSEEIDLKEMENKVVCIVKRLSRKTGNYTITLKMKFKDETFEYIGWLKIEDSPLYAEIRNGAEQEIPQVERKSRRTPPEPYILVLDGSESHDPDNPYDKSGIEYQWYCHFVNKGSFNLSNSFCDGGAMYWNQLNGNEKKMSINTSNFFPNAIYEFKLNISKGNRHKSTEQVVTVLEGEPPNIDLRCLSNCKTKINPMERLVIKYECKTCFGRPLTAQWYVRDNDNNTLDEYGISPTGFDQPSLVINENTLKEGDTYMFELMVKFRDAAAGTPPSKFILIKNTTRKPYDGECSISPKVGRTMETKFTIRCKNWQGRLDDRPIIYEFRYDTMKKSTIKFGSSNETDYPLLNPSSLSRYEMSNIILPAGLEEHGYKILLKIRIINMYGAYAEWNSSHVIVRPPPPLKSEDLESKPESPMESNEGLERNRTAQILDNVLKNEPKDRNDTQAVTAFVTSALSIVNGIDSTHKKEETGEKEDSYGGKGNQIIAEQNAKKKAVEREQKSEFKEKMVDMLNHVPMSNIQDIKVVSDALSSVTAKKDEISGNAQDAAVDLMSKMADGLKNLDIKKMGAVYFEQSTKNYVQSISNLFEVESAEVKKSEDLVEAAENTKGTTSRPTAGMTTTTAPTAAQKRAAVAKHSKENVNKLVNTLDAYLTTLTKNKVAGEKASVGKTDSFSFAISKKKPTEFENISVSADKDKGYTGSKNVSYGFGLPNMTKFFADMDLLETDEDIGIENVNFKNNIFSWDLNGSMNIKSEVVSLSMKAGDSNLNVSNLADPIIVTIKNKPGDMETKNITLYMPGEYKSVTSEVESAECIMLMDLKILNDFSNETQLSVYIQYGKFASSRDYDVMLNVSNVYGTIITKGKMPRNDIFEGNGTNINGTNKHTKDPFNITEYNSREDRNSSIYQIDNETLVMWQFDKLPYANATNRGKLFFTFVYSGPMPQRKIFSNVYTYDELELRGSFNYSLRTFCSACSYWSVEENEWKKDGCTLNPDKTDLYTTSCKCNHLTSFGGFFVKPNPLPVPSFELLKQGYVLLVTVSTILLLYILGLIMARRSDKADINKIGVCPLMDNDPADKYLYEITVNTGRRRNAGTKSNVFFNASGDISDSGTRHLRDFERRPFQSSSSDIFIMATPNSIGDINYIRIWHDNSGGSWYLRSVEIIDLQTEEKFLFVAERWLAVDEDDGMLDCLISVTGKEELKDFSYLFVNKTKRDLSDSHLWFSIYARPPRSSFTRCQRLSVAISLLFCAMVSNCMFYKVTDNVPEEENRIGNFSFKWSQVFIALIGACITIPINLILVGLFRVIRPSDYKPIEETPSEEDLYNNQDVIVDRNNSLGSVQLIDDNESKESYQIKVSKTNSNKGKKKKKAFYLPHWCLYPTWVLCILVILGCALVIVWYGMAFGNKKSLDWLASVTICLVQDILLLQPLKVFAMALFIALIVKRLEDEEKSELEKNIKSLSQDESWLHKIKKQGTIFDRIQKIEPPDSSALKTMKEIRLKELKMAAISREIMLYLLFTLTVFMIGFLTRDNHAYNQTVDIKELLKLSIRESATPGPHEAFDMLLSYQDFWKWTDALLLPEMYPKKWYELDDMYKNKDKYNFPGKIYLNDLNSKIVNGIRLRQLRVKPDSCSMAKEMRNLVSFDCAARFSAFDSEEGSFKYNWSVRDYRKPMVTPANSPWIYQSASTLDTYPIWAKLDTYMGGGYVLDLFPKWDNKKHIDKLKEKRWIDRHTRVVIVEFAIYNAQTNYFDMIMVVFEFPQAGGLVHYYSVATFRLFRHTNETAFFGIACEVLYLLFMVVFSIREARILYRTGWRYFKEFWNLVEIGMIVLSLLGIFFYFYRDVLKKTLLSQLPDKVPNKFINFHLASMWDDILIQIIALICFFVTLKFIKILRFNKRISMLSSTLNKAWRPLSMFGIMFFIVIAGVVFFATIIFGHTLYGYRHYFATLSSVLSLLLGKFSYYQFENTNFILGPIFFFTFNIMVNWIIMNMFISIINEAFASVQAEIMDQENEYEMVDYMVGHLKSWLGIRPRGKRMKSDGNSVKKEAPSETKLRRSSMLSRGSRSSQMKNSMKRSFLSASESSLNRSRHWRAEKLFVDDSSFLLEEEVSEEFVDETVDKFVKCINLLYFDDSK